MTGLALLDPADTGLRSQAAELYEHLFDESPVVGLGRRFLTEFFFTDLVRDGLIRTILYLRDGNAVGMVTYTAYPASFMAQGARNHPLRVMRALLAAVLAKPSRVRVLVRSFMFGRTRARHVNEKTGELLTFGVRHDFSRLVDEDSGQRLPNLLFDQALWYFKDRGFDRVEWNHRGHDAAPLVLYRSYGARIEKAPQPWPTAHRVVLELASARLGGRPRVIL